MPTTDQDIAHAVQDLVRSRYGRDGNDFQGDHPVSILEAGYATGRMWWGVQEALDRAGTSFRIIHIQTRLELAFRDLLLFPDDAPDQAWAQRYGYASPSALGRAFRGHFRVNVGEVRRAGRLGRWLALTDRQPRTAGGQARRSDAWDRISELRRAVKSTATGEAAAALALLGTEVPQTTGRTRPRHPPKRPTDRAPTLTQGRRDG